MLTNPVSMMSEYTDCPKDVRLSFGARWRNSFNVHNCVALSKSHWKSITRSLNKVSCLLREKERTAVSRVSHIIRARGRHGEVLSSGTGGGRHLERRFLSQMLTSWKSWTRQKFVFEDSPLRRFSYRKRWTTHIPYRICISQVGMERSCNPNTQLKLGPFCTRRGAQRCSSRRVGRVSIVSPRTDDAEVRHDFWIIIRYHIYRHHVDPRV